ncbi:MAG: cyclic nucleotide-binding domain-containing protein [Candidatus Anammoxibacter sp.]
MPVLDVIPGVKVYQDDKFSILFGCPPEIIKYFMARYIPFPDYVVIPDTINRKGVLQNSTEFVLYYYLFILGNIAKGKKLQILGNETAVKNNRELLRLTLLGPTIDEYRALDDPDNKNPYFDELYRESRAFAIKDKNGVETPIDGLANFLSFKKNDIETEHFKLTHKEANVYEVNGETIDINFSGYQVPPYDLTTNMIPMMPMRFGIDVLGGATGFSPTKPCSGYIINHNSDYMLIDCMPYIEYALKARGISRNQVKSVFMTHIHDDHCNLFSLVMFHKKVKILSTKEIFWMACKKLSLMTNHDISEFYSYFDFVELKPYEKNEFYGLTIVPHYTVHSIPTIGAEISIKCEGKRHSIALVSDCSALTEVKNMVDKGVVSQKKYDDIRSLYSNRYDILVADGGMGILHGDPKDAINSKAERVLLLHLEKLPDEFNTTFTIASHGKRFTIKEGTKSSYIPKILHILDRHYGNISEDWHNTLLNSASIVGYNTGDVIIKQGPAENLNVYIILSGNAEIIQHDGISSRRIAVNQAEDWIGEMAIINRVRERSASIVAGTPVTLCEFPEDVFYLFLHSEGRIAAMHKTLEVRMVLERVLGRFGFSVIMNQHIANAGKLIVFNRDDEVVRQGSKGNDFYIILKGKFDVVRDGKHVATMGAGEMFGEYGCLTENQRNATVSASEEGEVLSIKKHDINALIEKMPCFNFHLHQLMEERGEIAKPAFAG